MLQTIFLIFIGGGLGSLARFGVSMGVKQFSDGNFPVATLLSNLLSCLVMGIALSVFSAKMQDNAWRMFVIAGFCGGFSTFSTFSVETLRLFRDGNVLMGILNITISIVMCIMLLYFLIPSDKKIP